MRGGKREGAGAPLNNRNACKDNRLWRETINRLIVQSKGEALRLAAEALLRKAVEGEPWAIKELADRLDGRPI